MDAGRQSCNKRVCIAYIVTFTLLATFFYELLSSNRRSMLGLSLLREDIEYLTQSLREPLPKDRSNRQPTTDRNNFNSIDNKPRGCKGYTGYTGHTGPTGSAPVGNCDKRELDARVDALLKRKLDPIVDDVYSLKKQVMGGGCKFQNNQPSKNYEAMILPSTRINYASDELGARIENVQAKPICGTNFIKSMLGLDFSANPPINMLRASVSPGACFGFKGPKATVSIRLAKVILVEEIRVSHVPKEMTPQVCVDNAPKDFEVYGMPPNNQTKEMLGQWKYDNVPSKRTQSYTVQNKSVFRNLVFAFSSNHGGNSTCIYRVEVFGRLA